MELQIQDRAWAKLRYFVDNTDGEISGLGKIERDGDNFVVTDVQIFTQSVSGAHSDIPAQALAQFQVELMRQGESMEQWVLWWHSHAKMGVFFSQRDKDTIDESTDFRYMVSLVTNHKHELTARVDVYEPARLYSAIDVVVLEPDYPDIEEACKAEITKKLSKAITETKDTKYGYQKTIYDYDDDIGYSKSFDTLFSQRLEDYYTDREDMEEQRREAKKRGDKTAVQVAEYEIEELDREARRQGIIG